MNSIDLIRHHNLWCVSSVYSVCSGMSVQILRVNMVFHRILAANLGGTVYMCSSVRKVGIQNIRKKHESYQNLFDTTMHLHESLFDYFNKLS